MTMIKDAKGKGFGAAVTSENRMCTDAIVTTSERHINDKYAKYFSLPFDAIDPVGADDYFVYIDNTGTKNLHVTDIRIRSTVVGVVEVHGVTGTASFTAGTDITPVNRTVGNSNTITSTIKTDTDTTGLTNSGTFFLMRLDTADTDVHLKASGHIIIPPGQSIALLWDTATGILSGVISVYENQGVT